MRHPTVLLLAIEDANSQTPIAIATMTQISKSTTEDVSDTEWRTDTSEPIDPLLYLAGAPILHFDPPIKKPLKSASACVEFFGSHGYGKRIVFLLDISPSMNARSMRRFNRACDELVRSVSCLAENQRYHVLLFSWQTTFMFDLPKSAYVSAEAGHEARLRSWLYSVELGSGTDPRRALALAHQMNPDLVILLSDGQFNEPSRPNFPSGWIDEHGNPFNATVQSGVERLYQSVPIITIAFENPFTRQAMQGIADATGGSFRYVPTDSHEPIDTKGFVKATREIQPYDFTSTQWGIEQRRTQIRKRLAVAKQLIESGELAFAEFVIRPIELDHMTSSTSRAEFITLRNLLDDELGEIRLEDFGVPPGSLRMMGSAVENADARCDLQ